MNNWEIAKLFDEIADLLDILGENPYKARAYRRAAHKLGNAYLDVEELADEGRLQEIPGIGSALEKKIEEYVKTGDRIFNNCASHLHENWGTNLYIRYVAHIDTA
jgi:DNA polymerase (family 10)